MIAGWEQVLRLPYTAVLRIRGLFLTTLHLDMRFEMQNYNKCMS